MAKLAHLAAAVLSISLLTSGCLQSAFGNPSSESATAMDLLDRAKGLVGADGGQLLGVFTLETADGAEFADRAPPAWLMPFLNVTDSKVGDGRAGAWGFYFGGGAMAGDEADPGHSHDGMGDTIIIVDARGTEVYRSTVPMDFPIKASAPLGADWKVDSADAAAKAADEEWNSAVGSSGSYAFASLAIRIGSPAAWLFEAGVAQSQEGATVAADARDGLKIRLGNRDPFAPVKTESGEVSGAATTSGTSSAFTVEHGSHRQIEFFLEIDGGGGGLTQTGAQLDFLAKGPAGESFPFHWDGSGGTNQAWFQFDAPAPGPWSLEAKLIPDASTQETSQPFKVTWCALGASRC